MNKEVRKGNEIGENFVQKDVFKELELAENAVQDIYSFKEQFRVKTIYENFNSLFNFGNGFKFVLSFITASLAAIGFFFLFYFNSFAGVFNYILIFLASIFAISMSFGLEKARYTIAPIVAKSWLRDRKLQKGLFIAALSLQLVSIASTIYGTYKVIELFYTPQLADVGAVGGEQNKLIADYQSKIETAKADKGKIDKQREKYHKRTGKPSGWIEHEVYNQLTTDISTFEGEIAILRKEARQDKKGVEAQNLATISQHSESKYLFVWVAAIIALFSEILLSIILFLLEKYKHSTLKQLDTIQAPLQTVLQLVENPLTQLKSHLVGTGNGLVLATNTAANIPPITSNLPPQIQPLPTEQIPKIEAKKGNQIGFKTYPKTQPKNPHKDLNTQTVKTDELSKIELKIMHYKAKVRESENKLKTLKQAAAIERNKTALKNRKNKLRYWEKKKADFKGKTIA